MTSQIKIDSKYFFVYFYREQPLLSAEVKFAVEAENHGGRRVLEKQDKEVSELHIGEKVWINIFSNTFLCHLL